MGGDRNQVDYAAKKWKDRQLDLLDLDRIEAIADILSWIDTHVKPDEPAIIAVDAPTLIPNAGGMRLPDKLTHKYFGKYHAGCYPANLNLPFAERTVKFGLELEARGFTHAPEIEPQKQGRYQIEVFPHPAIVNLFNLERILKYKKGKLAERHLELTKLHQFIVNILPTLEPPLNLKQGKRSEAQAIHFILHPSLRQRYANTLHPSRCSPQSSRRSTRQPDLCLCSCTLVVLGTRA